MTHAGQEHARIAFPATAEFGSVGRVAVAGIALRLGIDVAKVEDLRLAVSTSIEALAGPGTVTLFASWTDEEFSLELTNPDADPIDTEVLKTKLGELAVSATVGPTQVDLQLAR